MHGKITNIRETLLRLNLINNHDVRIFSNKTRDNDNLVVYRDDKTKIIFIDNYYVGDKEYEIGDYRTQLSSTLTSSGELEDYLDVERRFKKYKQFIVNKKICDFGCGDGSFLNISKSVTQSLIGIEIEKKCIQQIYNNGIKCVTNLDGLSEPLDAFFLFHCLEHLPDPIEILKNIHKKLKSHGVGHIVIEVPHARDFLLDYMDLDSFKNFTLWSQHLILHTRQSLQVMLIDAGFNNILIEGVQRYGFDNHLNWLRYGQSGGHKNPLSVIVTDSLKNSYADSLSKMDANDTLVAIATT